ncbi:unnamed protein product [Haemonchus placei]|uniref:Uncharacterized protein n=1 Tax=Haemonchus placei TaxID=6290 RepID=A0A0N4X8Q4_HAEPC|nr:unnamed protein product [Haemonchus placei]
MALLIGVRSTNFGIQETRLPIKVIHKWFSTEFNQTLRTELSSTIDVKKLIKNWSNREATCHLYHQR